MENKLLKNPQHVARLGYNPFAMHQIVDRTDTVGQITPCYYDFLQPGDKITASVKLQTRTQPLLAPAYCSVRECVDRNKKPINAFTDRTDRKSVV